MLILRQKYYLPNIETLKQYFGTRNCCSILVLCVTTGFVKTFFGDESGMKIFA